jgi:maltoporin
MDRPLMICVVSCALLLPLSRANGQEPAAGQEETGVVGERDAYLTPFATQPQLTTEEVRRITAFQFHGYLRAGAGVNTNGGNQVCFQAPGAPVKYRLGNECDAYTELLVNYDVYRPTRDGPLFRANARLAFDAGWLVRFQDVEIFAPEIYVEGRNLFGSGALKSATFWAGKRYYRQEQVHINDFYFWDLSAPGAGVEGIDLRTGKLAVAYLRNAGLEPGTGAAVATPLDTNQSVSIGHARWYDVPVNEGGTLNLGGEVRDFQGPRRGVVGSYGLAFNALHTQKVGGGFNQLIFQYGQGLAASIGISSDLAAENDARTYRLIDWLLIQPSPRWNAGLVAIYQRATGVQSHPQDWVSLGARPIYNVSDHLRIALEVGADVVDPRDGDARRLAKVTLAPELSAGRDFFARPVLRVFVTYASWNQAAADNGVVLSDVGVSPFAGDRDGLTIGVQTEAWW